MSPAERLLEFCLRVERVGGESCWWLSDAFGTKTKPSPHWPYFPSGSNSCQILASLPVCVSLYAPSTSSLSPLSLSKHPGPLPAPFRRIRPTRVCGRSRCSGVSYRRSVRVLPSAVVPRAEVIVCESYLVDPASSHMLVSKTKPCMSKYERFIQ